MVVAWQQAVRFGRNCEEQELKTYILRHSHDAERDTLRMVWVFEAS